MERKFSFVQKIGAAAISAAKSKKLRIILIQALVMVACVFATDTVSSVNQTINQKMSIVIQVIYSPWVKALFGIVVGGKAISFIVNHEQGTFKKLLPLAAAAAIYFVAPTIANALIDVNTAGQYSVNQDTGKIE